MALYSGEETVSVTTPDGRTLDVPKSVANQLLLPQPDTQAIGQGGVDPIGPPGSPPNALPMPETGPLPTPPPDAQAGGMVPGQDAMGNPTLSPGESYAPPPTPAPQPDFAVEAPQMPAKPQGGKPAPAARPPTAIQKVQAAGDAARDAQSQAEIDQANIEAAGQWMVGNAFEKRNAEIDKLMAKKAADEAAGQQEQAKKVSELEAMKTKIAGTKIDRNADHPILSGLMIMLGGIGTAWNKQDMNQNPAWLAFNATLDRKVAGQQADLDQLNKLYGMTKEEVQTIREKWTDRRAMHQALVAAETEKSARHIEEITARTNSEAVKQNGIKLAAAIRERGTVAAMDAVKFQMDFDQKDKHQKQQLGYQYSVLGETKRKNAADEQLEREKMFADVTKSLAAEKARGGEAAFKARQELVKTNEERGLRNVNRKPGDAEYLLTGRGRQMLDQAAALESQAQAASLVPGGAANAQALRNQASLLRGDAQTDEVIRARDTAGAKGISDKYAAAQQLGDMLDGMKSLADKNGKAYFSSNEGQATLKSQQVEFLMALKDAWALGVLSKSDMTTLQKAMGGDPVDGWTAGNMADKIGLKLGTDPDAWQAAVGSLVKGSQDRVVLDLRANSNFAGSAEDIFAGRKPQDKAATDAAAGILKDKTPGEVAAGERNVGTGRKALNAVADIGSNIKEGFVGNALGNTDSRAERNAKTAENSGSVTHAGLTPGQAASFDSLTARAKSNDPKKAETARNQIFAVVGGNRPDVAQSVLSNLRDKDPGLYAQAIKHVRDPQILEVVDAWQAQDAQPKIDMAQGAAKNVVVGTQDNRTLGQQATVGMDDAYSELARRAARGDKEAANIVKTLLGKRGN